jgi:antitoxin HigA-1
MKPHKITQEVLASTLKLPIRQVHELINGKRGITPTLAQALAGVFNTTDQFWLNLQKQHDDTISG